jgi:hypothetical protein
MTGGDQFLRLRLYRFLLKVGEHHRRACVRESLCRSQSHARCGTSDECHLDR